MTTVIQGTTKKPVSSRQLVEFFARSTHYEGFLYVGYPIIGTSEGPYPIDALWVSREKGIVIFNLIEGRNLDNYKEDQDDSVNKLEAKLRIHKSLMKGRNLTVPINVLTFAPAREDVIRISEEGYPLCNISNLQQCIDNYKWDEPSCYNPLVSVIQAISTIRKGRKKRIIAKKDSRGEKLQRLEDSVSNLDNQQGRAVIETVDGVQRIRGLAGSGKTIVLALKAAYLHAQHPDWKIAVTFNTRSLKGQFRQLINTFTIEQTNEEPDWDNIHIIHAWGAPGGGERSGIYHTFCQIHGLEYYDFNSAKEAFGRNTEFEGACQTALEKAVKTESIYDAILVDEAQDFPPCFLRLCYELLKPEKRLVYAYDELQNLSLQSLPSPEEIFGNKEDGTPRVRFGPIDSGKPQQDIILNKCYRNSRPVLVTAHALGFGIYREPDPETGTGLVQIFDQSQLWVEVGYSVESGELADGHDVTLARNEESSPIFLENHSPIDDLLQFHCFDTQKEQARWLADEIIKNLKEDELRPDDIMIINPDPLTTREAVGEIRKILFENNINSHLTGVDTSPDVFFDTNHESVVFTGIFRAKGNETGMVYIINAQDCYTSFAKLPTVRNRLFTAITRSKAWVRVLGIGDNMRKLKEEFDQIKRHEFKLQFRYPTKKERENLNIVNRDMSEAEKEHIRKGKNEFAALVEDLEAGRFYLEDLGADKIKRLRALLKKNGDN